MTIYTKGWGVGVGEFCYICSATRGGGGEVLRENVHVINGLPPTELVEYIN